MTEAAVPAPRLLITGASGFVGGHLLAHLQSGAEAHIFALSRSADRWIEPHARVEVRRADLLDRESVRAVVADVQPDGVFHLAAQSSAGESFVHPIETLNNNIVGELNLLEALAEQPRQPRIVVVCSADEYGLLRSAEHPITEEAELRPTSPYAVSKVLQDMLAFQYFAARGLPTIRVRPFSHTGPGHDERFLVPAIAKQIVEIERGLREPLVRVGNLDVQRDYTDVRDMVRAYHLALLTGQPGEVYNLGSQRAVSIRELLDMLAAATRARFTVEVDPALTRPADVPKLLCDATKFRQLTSWQPQIPLEQTLTDTLNYWRARVVTVSGGRG